MATVKFSVGKTPTPAASSAGPNLPKISTTINQVVTGGGLHQSPSDLAEVYGSHGGGAPSPQTTGMSYLDQMVQLSNLLHVDPQGINRSYNLALNAAADSKATLNNHRI